MYGYDLDVSGGGIVIEDDTGVTVRGTSQIEVVGRMSGRGRLLTEDNFAQLLGEMLGASESEEPVPAGTAAYAVADVVQRMDRIEAHLESLLVSSAIMTGAIFSIAVSRLVMRLLEV